jgi:hypothetical protein
MYLTLNPNEELVVETADQPGYHVVRVIDGNVTRLEVTTDATCLELIMPPVLADLEQPTASR